MHTNAGSRPYRSINEAALCVSASQLQYPTFASSFTKLHHERSRLPRDQDCNHIMALCKRTECTAAFPGHTGYKQACKRDLGSCLSVKLHRLVAMREMNSRGIGLARYKIHRALLAVMQREGHAATAGSGSGVDTPVRSLLRYSTHSSNGPSLPYHLRFCTHERQLTNSKSFTRTCTFAHAT